MMADPQASEDLQPLDGSPPRRLRLKQPVKATANQSRWFVQSLVELIALHRNLQANARFTSKGSWSLSTWYVARANLCATALTATVVLHLAFLC
jgi:hypothetical protein